MIASRAVGSSRDDMIGRAIMLDVVSEQRGQPDHWVLVAVVCRRLRIDGVAARAGIAASAARGWLETDETFHQHQRVRLTAEGRALLGNARRSHPPERRRPSGHIRRRLPTRHLGGLP